MSESRQRFGLSVALATPFRPNGEIDLERLVSHAGRCLELGCDSITLFGTTGEGVSIGHQERLEVLAALAAAGVGAGSIVAGISATASADAKRDVTVAQGRGCRAVLLPPPFYFKQVADDGIFDWYRAVFEDLGENARNIILYNIPSLTGVQLSVELIARLRAAFSDIIIGVKDSTGDWSYTERLLAAHRDLAVLIGEERHLAAAVRLGAEGSICGLANLHPAEMRTMAWQGADNVYIDEVVGLVSDFPVVPAIKALMAHRNGEPQWRRVRPPLISIGDRDLAEIGRGFDRLANVRAA